MFDPLNQLQCPYWPARPAEPSEAEWIKHIDGCGHCQALIWHVIDCTDLAVWLPVAGRYRFTPEHLALLRRSQPETPVSRE
jgi:hypothetical protein